MSKQRTIAFVLGFVCISVGGWFTDHSIYPAFAFVFGAWGFAVLEGGSQHD